MKNSQVTVTLPSRPDEEPTQLLDSTKQGSAPVDESFPFPEWERYQGVKFLGQGGMGRVFLAYEPLLQRNVALKFVRRDDSELVRRLLEEARAQARVKHERVCEVLEVGEVQGQPYIAMQFIDGEPLGKLARSLTLKEKVRVLRDAAEGVQATHRESLIHRDIKPSNILVERTRDGRLKPYIMDFGLARDWRERSSTATGSILGTVEYMSPEQARGEVSRLDRRSDIYSLGATLYEILTGVPPFTGKSQLEVLGRILTQEPRKPRSLNPDISRGLETIVLKCLAKDRSARYESATALIQDLDRFLADEPIPHLGMGYWIRTKVRKHRVLVSVATVGFLAVTLALGWATYTRAQITRLLGSFTGKVKSIEDLALASGLTKPHDTREDVRRMRALITDLEAEIREAGNLASGPGNYALARGFLALGELETARLRLEAASESGFREPRVSYTQALVLGRLYQQRLLKAGGESSQELREASKKQVQSEFLPRILASLKESQTGSATESSPEYVEALIAFYEERFDDALEKLAARREALPWAYEPLQLEGDIHRARAIQLWNRGEVEGARAGFEAGRRAYASAIEIGRSVPALYLAQGELALAEMSLELYSGGDTRPSFERGRDAVRRALTVAPEEPGIFLLEASLYRRAAESGLNLSTEQEAETLLQHALEAALGAVRLRPTAQAYLELGQCYSLWGQSRQRRGEDPSEQLREAARYFEEARKLGPQDSYSVHNALGVVYATWAEYTAGQGTDPGPLLDKAIDAYREATRLGEGLFNAWRNLADAYCQRAMYQLMAVPSGDSDSELERDLENAREAARKARSINDQQVILYYTEGLIHELEARLLRIRGGNSPEAWTQAIASYREGLRLAGSGKPSYLLHQEGTALLELARDTWDRGGNPLPFLDAARAAYASVSAEHPTEAIAHYNLVSELLLRAQLQAAQGESPEVSLRAALAGATQGLEQLKDPSLLTLLGGAYTQLAEFELEQGRDARQSVARAKEALRDALEHNSRDAQALLYRGVLHGLQARSGAQRGPGEAEAFQEALKDFHQSIQLSHGSLDFRIALGRFCQEWAARAIQTGQDYRVPLDCGLEQARYVRAARAQWADGLVLASSLLMLEAESASSPMERSLKGRQALEDLSQALALNSHLTRRWERQRLRLQQLLHARP